MNARLGLQRRPLRLLRHVPFPGFPRPNTLPLRRPANLNPYALPSRAAYDPRSPCHRGCYGVLPALHHDSAEGEMGSIWQMFVTTLKKEAKGVLDVHGGWVIEGMEVEVLEGR